MDGGRRNVRMGSGRVYGVSVRGGWAGAWLERVCCGRM
jgi:hypothetical protein